MGAARGERARGPRRCCQGRPASLQGIRGGRRAKPCAPGPRAPSLLRDGRSAIWQSEGVGSVWSRLARGEGGRGARDSWGGGGNGETQWGAGAQKGGMVSNADGASVSFCWRGVGGRAVGSLHLLLIRSRAGGAEEGIPVGCRGQRGKRCRGEKRPSATWPEEWQRCRALFWPLCKRACRETESRDGEGRVVSGKEATTFVKWGGGEEGGSPV